MKINLKAYIIWILFVFFVQAFFTSVNAACDFECRIENGYQQKVADTIKNKYNTENLSEDELKILKDTINVANKDNYKILTSIIKKESIEDLSRVSDLKINENLKNSNADKKSYDIAYTLARKGLFTEIHDENQIKSVIQTMYNCENPIDDYKLAVYASTFLFHKEDKYDFKTLLDKTTKENYESILNEIISNAKFDSNRFFPDNREVASVLVNLPKSMQDEITMQNNGKYITLSPAKCIISPSYHITNMMLVSMDMYGASKKGAFVGLFNPLNIVSDIVLSPLYLLMNNLMKEPIKNIQEL